VMFDVHVAPHVDTTRTCALTVSRYLGSPSNAPVPARYEKLLKKYRLRMRADGIRLRRTRLEQLTESSAIRQLLACNPSVNVIRSPWSLVIRRKRHSASPANPRTKLLPAES